MGERLFKYSLTVVSSLFTTGTAFIGNDLGWFQFLVVWVAISGLYISAFKVLNK